MNIGSCKSCNATIKYDKIPICNECEKMFLSKVKEYISENGVQKPDAICKATGVPLKVITYFIDEGILYDVDQTLDLEDQTKMDKYRTIVELNKLKKQLENENSNNKQTKESLGFLANRKR